MKWRVAGSLIAVLGLAVVLGIPSTAYGRTEGEATVKLGRFSGWNWDSVITDGGNSDQGEWTGVAYAENFGDPQKGGWARALTDDGSPGGYASVAPHAVATAEVAAQGEVAHADAVGTATTYFILQIPGYDVGDVVMVSTSFGSFFDVKHNEPRVEDYDYTCWAWASVNGIRKSVYYNSYFWDEVNANPTRLDELPVGVPIEVVMTADVFAGLDITWPGYLGYVRADCGIFWGGIDEVYDLDDTPLFIYSALGAYGADWTQPHELPPDAPEPTTMSLLGLGLGALLVRRRKRN